MNNDLVSNKFFWVVGKLYFLYFVNKLQYSSNTFKKVWTAAQLESKTSLRAAIIKHGHGVITSPI